MNIRTILLALAMSLALASAGCGDGDEEASSKASAQEASSKARTPVSKAEFVKGANAICKEERADLSEEIADYERRQAGRTPRPYADVVHFVFLPVVEEEIRKVEELDWPTGEEERVNWLLFAQQASLDSLAVKPRVASLQAAKERFANAGRNLRAYGLVSCAWAPSS